ncbi:MAG: sigma-70 family RNA polymerase sigma factor [Chloroflexota bacterium]|nr:sigma-70 family RNA polymerase sigma factor [Chloroflexota bacterium]
MHSSADEPGQALRTFLQENVESLQGIVRSYVIRAGLAYGDGVQSATADVLNETTLQALAHAEVFDTVQQPRAWFLGIAANVIKRRRTSRARQNQCELSVGAFRPDSENGSESDFFDQLGLMTQPGPEQEVETRAQVAELLALASPDDRLVLRLAFLHDLDTRHLALALNIPPSTARVRLHRALNRVRTAWCEHLQHLQERGSHA